MPDVNLTESRLTRTSAGTMATGSRTSITSIEQPVSKIFPRPNRSIKRPGVAMRTSTPFSSAAVWSPIETPPISNAIESL